VRRLALPERAAALAQVERVEREAALGPELGQLGLEEVVAEAVDVDHRAARRALVATTHQRGVDPALAVGILAEVDRQALVRLAQDVRAPGVHVLLLRVARPP